MSRETDALGRASRELSERDISSVLVHSSMRRLAKAGISPGQFLSVLSQSVNTVIAPAFLSTASAGPPDSEGAGPALNGTNYSSYRRAVRKKDIVPFVRQAWGPRSDVDPEMGVLPRLIGQQRQACRSPNPVVSWVGKGKGVERLLRVHPRDDPNRVIKQLLDDYDSWVILVDVDLTKCTAIHLAEELAGRRAFVRWIRTPDEAFLPVKMYGCSHGFERGLRDPLSGVEESFKIAASTIRLYRLRELVDGSTQTISGNPRATICRDNCLRCLHAALGGPLSTQ
jgi:aminoglycoside N3'-acetyltransferase